MTHHQPTTPPDGTQGPMLDGPECPSCLTPAACRPAPGPDPALGHAGDLWTCERGHEFVLTLEGLTVPPEDVA